MARYGSATAAAPTADRGTARGCRPCRGGLSISMVAVVRVPARLSPPQLSRTRRLTSSQPRPLPSRSRRPRMMGVAQSASTPHRPRRAMEELQARPVDRRVRSL